MEEKRNGGGGPLCRWEGIQKIQGAWEGSCSGQEGH